MTYVVAVRGLSDLRAALADLPEDVRRSAQLAVNFTLRKTRTSASRQILDQVNFGSAYLNDKDRLAISKFATPRDLSGSILGRDRPTSLARFATASGKGVTIQVKPGSSRRSKRAFFIKLKAGSASIESKFNQGLAIRLKQGEQVKNKKDMVQIAKGLYLLYGPSVAQVFEAVASASAPVAADYLEKEFIRLMEL
jgi:hypothetical protein